MFLWMRYSSIVQLHDVVASVGDLRWRENSLKVEAVKSIPNADWKICLIRAQGNEGPVLLT